MIMRRLFLSILVSMPLAVPLPALAQGSATTSGQAKAPAPSAAWTEGVVRTIHKQTARSPSPTSRSSISAWGR